MGAKPPREVSNVAYFASYSPQIWSLAAGPKDDKGFEPGYDTAVVADAFVNENITKMSYYQFICGNETDRDQYGYQTALNGKQPTAFPGIDEEGEEIWTQPLIDTSQSQIDLYDEVGPSKIIFVTGAAGSIGSEIARQVTECKITKLVLIDQAESALYDLQQEFLKNSKNNFSIEVGDVRDKKRMKSLFEYYSPHIIFHAAAYKHVPLMEGNPYEAIRVNVEGTRVIADLSLENNAEKFVMISTDKAVNPTNVMGATKRIAEIYTSCLSIVGTTKFITTRFGNVLGSNGSVVPLFKKQLESGGPLTVTHKDITRYFMTIPEACQLVLEAGIMGNGGEIYVFDMGDAVKIYDIAIKIIQLSGLSFPKDIDIKITGLRPGEKLYEELLANDENTLPTYHGKILIAKVPPIDCESMKKKIEDLCELNSNSKSLEVVSMLKDVVPEYKSNNSIYEELDEVSEY